MTEREFVNKVANGQEDIIQILIDLLYKNEIGYCLIGGLAVNAYVEPVVSLDLDIIVATNSINKLCQVAEKIFTIKEFEHSLNLKSPKSDLRIQVQTDPRYQAFISKANVKNVMGYDMKVAAIENILQGKIWAYSDQKRRKSKRQKDLADIFRLVETYSHLNDLLPDSIKSM